MKINATDKGEILLTEVYSGVLLRTNDGETMGICMRDSGFEFNYEGEWYSAQKGVVSKMESVVVTEDTQKYTGQEQDKKMYSEEEVDLLGKLIKYNERQWDLFDKGIIKIKPKSYDEVIEDFKSNKV